MAVSSNGDDWFLLNASPDITRQIEAFPALLPHSGRGSRIRGIVLTNGDLDHCLGLLLLREWTPIVVYATASVRRGLEEHNVLFRTLQRYPGQLTWKMLQLGREVPLETADSEPSGLSVTALPLLGKPPVHLEGITLAHPEQNVGLRLRDAHHKRLVYAPGIGVLSELAPIIDGADAALLDGTFWYDDELERAGAGRKTARDLAHCPLSGPKGVLGALPRQNEGRVWFTHINNTNPILRASSAERRELEARGFGVAYDGLEVTL